MKACLNYVKGEKKRHSVFENEKFRFGKIKEIE